MLNALRGVGAGCDHKAGMAKQATMPLAPIVDALAAWCWVALDALATLLNAFLAAVAVRIVRQRNLWAIGVKVVGGEVMRYTELARQVAHEAAVAGQMVKVNMADLQHT